MMDRVCSMHGDKRNAYRSSVGKHKEGGLLEGLDIDRLGNIKIDFREIVRGATDWINLAQDKNQPRTLVNTLMNLWVP
jgi:hypothetical protein